MAALGYEDAALRSLAMMQVGKAYKHSSTQEQLELLKKLIEEPEAYRSDRVLGPVALRILEIDAKTEHYELQENKSFKVYGAQYIEPGALEQMRQAMRLPISLQGALMPDAHQGYGLPIGGVLAADNAVIPYGVGVDIGCRMCLSVWDSKADMLESKQGELKKILLENSRFGIDTFEDKKRDDALFEDPRFGQTHLLRSLRDKAYQQIGSSGGGNHFVEFGSIELAEGNTWHLPAGNYLALLSHSGSRGLGARIANHYTQVAMRKRNTLPKELKQLSWLGLDEPEGMEYWAAMNLAGDYASANHRHIHERVERALRSSCLLRVENHHNFAWEEELADGRKAIVHRKGATPAQEGLLGIIPGSMTAPAYLVRGKGAKDALQSASHGAGRRFSRKQAKESYSKAEFKKHLQEMQVELLSAGLDEAPFAYKDIREIIQAQGQLLEVLARFYPKIVRMDQERERAW